MKKVYLSLASMFVGLVCVTAQSFINTPSYIDRKMELPHSIAPVVKNSAQSATTRWYSYWAYKDALLGNIGVTYGNYLFPDSNIKAEFSGSTYGGPWIHNLGYILDPRASVFNNPALVNPGELLIRPSDTYVLDSAYVDIIFERNTSTIDTLVIEVQLNANLNQYTPTNWTGVIPNLATVNSAVDSIMFKMIPYTYQTNSLNLPAPKFTRKVPLDSAFHADSTQSGFHRYQFDLSGSGLPAVGAGRFVTTNVFFKPSYSYSYSDTLNTKNYVRLLSVEERGGPTNANPSAPHTFPYYEKRDFNVSYVVLSDTKYNSSSNGWNGYFRPSLAFMGNNTSGNPYPDWAFENHRFGYKLSCTTCDAISTNDIDRNVAKLGNAFPNPAELGENIVVPVTLANAGEATLKFYNAIGQEVKTVNAKDLVAGLNRINVNTANFTPGVYLYSLELDGNVTATQRLTVVK